MREGIVDGDRVGGFRKGGSPAGVPGGDNFFCRPAMPAGSFGKEVSQLGSLGSLEGLELSQSGLFGDSDRVMGQESFDLAGGFGDLFAEGGEDGVHQGLHLEEGREREIEASIVERRTERVEENQISSCLGEGVQGGGGVR